MRVEAFVVFDICRAESETISQVVGNQLRKGTAGDFGKPVPFFSDISLLIYKSKQEFIGPSPPSTSHLYHNASSSGTRRYSKLIPAFRNTALTSYSCSSSCSLFCNSGLLISILATQMRGRAPIASSRPTQLSGGGSATY